MRRQATLKDVAERAGVHPSTVSRVLNDRRRMPISPETVARIKDAARELDYVPHAAARALVGRRTQTIGLIWFELTDPAQAALAQSVQGLVEAQGYHLIVSSLNSHGRPDLNYTRLVTEGRADALLVIASTSLSPLIAQQLRSKNALIVGAGPPPLPEACAVLTAWVTHDNLAGARMLGRHLGELGHRQVGYLGPGTLARRVGTLRQQGLESGLQAVDAAAVVHAFDAGDTTFEAGSRAAPALLERVPELTALFAYNDRMAMGAMQALWRLGRRVPDAISVAGYQDLDLAEYTIPPLTTVRVPRQRIAEQAVALLFRALDGEELPQRELVVPTELVVRASTAPPAEGYRG